MLFSLPPHMQLERASLFHQSSSDTQLVVLSAETEANLHDGYVIYRGGVRAKYGVTNLIAELLIVRKGNSGDPAVALQEGGKSFMLRPNEAYAVGKVNLVDPDGTLQASNFWFTWDSKRRENPTEVVGQADDVNLQLSSSHILAKSISMSKAGFEMTKVSFWTGSWRTPLYRFDAETATVIPGKQGIARNVRIYILNVPLPAIRRYTFSLDPRSTGMHIPNLGFRQGAGVGVSWQTNYLVNEASLVSHSIPMFNPTTRYHTYDQRLMVIRLDQVSSPLPTNLVSGPAIHSLVMYIRPQLTLHMGI
jgi:lipopolysaccharide assembly outer membrane protein LptD (OstA)